MSLRNLFLPAEKAESNEVWIEPNSDTTGKILGYFGRTTDRDQIETAILRRYGTGIKSEKTPTGTVRESYVVNGFDDRLSLGHVEVVSSGFGHNLTTAVANLFTEPGLKFSLTGPGDLSQVSDFFDEFRETSQFLDGMVTADKESFQVGCSILWLEFYEGLIKYRTVDPGKVKVLFHPLVEADNGDTRPVNYSDLEDATCVVIETGSFEDGQKSYLAIFGRSGDYPLGRYVTYQSSGDGKDIPDPGAGAFDWRVPGVGVLANPLSFYAEQHPDLNVPEYPIAIFYGGHVRRDRLFPVSDSVLKEALEADMSASHLRAVSNDHARGSRVIERDKTAAGLPLPKNLYGTVSLEPGQKLVAVDGNASAAEIAWKILKEGGVASAQGYGVPDFYVSSEDHTLDASSGVALKVRSTPLLRFRAARVNLNRPSVDKVFIIERTLISLFSDDPLAETLEKCDQTWEPSTLSFPEDAAVKVENVEKLVAMGVYDTIEAMQVIYQLPSEQDAIDRYVALAKRAKQYPPLTSLPAGNTGDEKNENGLNKDDIGSSDDE